MPRTSLLSPKLTFYLYFSNFVFCFPKTLVKNPEQSMFGLIFYFSSLPTVSAFVLIYTLFLAVLFDFVSTSSLLSCSSFVSRVFFPPPSLVSSRSLPFLFHVFVFPALPGAFRVFPSSPSLLPSSGFRFLFFSPLSLRLPVRFFPSGLCPLLRFVRPLFPLPFCLLMVFPPPSLEADATWGQPSSSHFMYSTRCIVTSQSSFGAVFMDLK